MDHEKLLFALLVLIRFGVVLLPQSGYIHPDEFFQSSEIVYGDSLDLHHLRTWEFDPEKPIRSISIPYILHSLPLMVFKIFGVEHLLRTPQFPYLLLIFPRLVMCLLSFGHDFCILQTCRCLGRRPAKPLLVFASSYVLLVYYQRTFSNSLEALCSSIIMCLVLRSHHRKTSALMPQILGILITVGFFIRPTFLLFSCVPFVFWMFVLSWDWNQIFKKLTACMIGVFLAFIPLTVADTLYYTEDFSLFKPNALLDLPKKLVFTTLNFILYNLKGSNLASHGTHPHYLHILVNVPLTFSVLGMNALLLSCKVMYRMVRYKRLACSKLDLFMLSSFMFPILCLSIFQHQEPRFLIPSFFPLVFLFSDFIRSSKIHHNVLTVIWVATNLLGVMFFGFLHQGGLVPSLAFLQSKIANSPKSDAFHLVFYHTYMPPRYLLAVPKVDKRVHIHDLGGMNDDALLETLKFLVRNSGPNDHHYIVAPSTIMISIVNANIVLNPHHQLKLVKTFFPHVTTEDLPAGQNVWNVLSRTLPLSDKLFHMSNFFKLCIYKIEPT